MGDLVETLSQRFADARRSFQFRTTPDRKTLQFPELNIASPIDARARGVPRSAPRVRIMSNDNNIDFVALSSGRRTFPLSAEESGRFLRIVSSALLIERHYQLFLWLRGEVQEFLPHQILVSAWGDFGQWDLKLDVVSAVPGARTEALRQHPIDDLLKSCYTSWVAGGRRPLVVKAASLLESLGTRPGAIYDAMRDMRSVLVHGVHDARSGHDSLYVVMNSGSITEGRARDQFAYVMDSLIGQIDLAFRRVAALPIARAKGGGEEQGDWLELSAREQEILDWLCQGKTNIDIATALDISPYTVKNHVQRIFKKIGVNNRTQAAAKYSQAFKELRKYLEDKADTR